MRRNLEFAILLVMVVAWLEALSYCCWGVLFRKQSVLGVFFSTQSWVNPVSL